MTWTVGLLKAKPGDAAHRSPQRTEASARSPSTVRVARLEDRPAWDALVAAHGSFLQSWRWGDFRAAQGWAPIRLVAEEDGTLTGVMQALVRRFRPSSALLYVPRGPAVADSRASPTLLATLGPLARRHGAWLARVEPDVPASHEAAALLRDLGLRPAAVTVQLPHTVLVDLSPPPEQILARFKPTWRRYVRHAPRRGVVVRQGTVADLDAFYRLERETARRQGILGRPLAYYRHFFEQFEGAGAQLFLAELAGEPLGAILTLEAGQTATYLYGGSTRRHQEAHANYLLQWTAMLHAREAGCQRYDLWGCGALDDRTGPEAGLTAFKSGFGPVVTWAGTWDLPASPLYRVWRVGEARRKQVLQTLAQRSAGRHSHGTTEKDDAMGNDTPVVRDVTAAPAAQWDAWLAASPGGGHWMQTHAWGAFKRSRGREAVRVLMEDGGHVAGAAEIILYRLPLIGRLAYCAKGPWLDWSRPDYVAAFCAGVRRLLRGRRVFALQIEPEALEADVALKAQLEKLGFRRYWTNHQFKTTMIVDLAPDEQALQARMSQTARRYIRAGQRAGVEVVEETSPQAQATFYQMFVDTSRRDGFFMRPKHYLQAGWQALIDAGHGRFLFARKDGQNLAAMFLTSFNGKIWYKDGASLGAGQQTHATYVLQWEAMRWGKAHGATSYDMVAIPDPDQLDNREHEMWGLYDFKRKFGGQVREFIRAYKQPYLPRAAALWDRLEPLYYRVYMRLKRDVYY